LDEVRAAESRKMAQDGYPPLLKKSRWCVLKRKTESHRAADSHDRQPQETPLHPCVTKQWQFVFRNNLGPPLGRLGRHLVYVSN
jgi:hypothetical protein